MSLNTKQTLKCPKCGQMSDITVWNSITVSDSPDLKDDLLKGRVNIFRCPTCERVGLMSVPLLYHDEDKRLMISFSPTNDVVLAEQLYEQVSESSKNSGELEKLEGYNLRFVTDYNELLEKILIFDMGLNDKAVEVIKLMILSQELDKAEQRSARFGKLENDTLEFMIIDTIENQVYTSSVPKSSYDTVWQSLRESGVKPYSFDWERVNGTYATKLLNGFNN